MAIMMMTTTTATTTTTTTTTTHTHTRSPIPFHLSLSLSLSPPCVVHSWMCFRQTGHGMSEVLKTQLQATAVSTDVTIGGTAANIFVPERNRKTTTTWAPQKKNTDISGHGTNTQPRMALYFSLFHTYVFALTYTCGVCMCACMCSRQSHCNTLLCYLSFTLAWKCSYVSKRGILLISSS